MKSLSEYKIRFETLGCRLNQIESEGAAHFFVQKGFSSDMTPVSSVVKEDTDTVLCIINTCSVTQKAEQKARRIIRLVLKKYQNASVIVTGCYAQLRPEEIKKMDKRISVLKGQLKSRLTQIPEMLEGFLKGEKWNAEKFSDLLDINLFCLPQEKTDTPENSFLLATDSFIAHSRSSLKIQDGCNNNCSYCTIHMARGNSVSLNVQSVIERVKALENKGMAEVVFTTVNIAHYRGEYEGEYLNFSRMLRLVLDATQKIRIRISSIYPEIVDDEFCDVIKDSRVCPHFHISVQSGSDKILSLMERHYNRNDVIEACKKIRSVKENPFLACDIITGFPGETDSDFEETLDLCRKCGFSWVHAFPFSERPGTKAVLLENKIPQSVSKNRALRLTKWAAESKIDYIKKCEGKVFPCVVETVRRPKVFAEGKVIYHAVTSNFLHCQIEVNENTAGNLSGKLLNVKIEKPLFENITKGGETECTAVLCL
ncbi:MAG: tRNA (N(6)-L-threonylcarbamoyladenosine(37)-C(2))-methylthiotransferase MtaB [Treponema sp.]|nr:tRNA (N(6)-L-threonylcarbamoyladenosine(37)-C(2))-methylthiotransferase MtaB [Treponema sp.]